MMRAAVLWAYEAEDIKPGWVALVLVLALAVATFLLWRSMNKQLRRINVPTQQEIRDAEAAEPQHGGTAERLHGETDGGDDEENPPR
ncbi:MAG: hypothetical protein M3499_04190 [Actinomycetota bacterium]|nr:hypothetical protein [Actinomycetota bacterium]